MDTKTIKVLAIDDNRDNLISLRALILEAFPTAIVLLAQNGILGLELAANEDPDIVLLDIIMPEIDGFEVCKKLKSNKALKDIPVVFVTAIKGDKASRIHALECGAEAFLSKPIDETELKAEIRAMVKIKTANIEKRNEKERLAKLVAERTEELEKELKKRQLTEMQLRENEQQYRNLANSGMALIWSSGVDKLCYYFNEPWLHFTGRTLEQELGHGWADGVHPEDYSYCLDVYCSSFDKRIKFEMEYRLLHHSGEYRWIRDLGTPIYNSAGFFIGYIGHCFDITSSKQIEVELIKAKEKAEESDRLKSAFLANMSHEIRTPMNGILGFANLLKEPNLTGDEKDEYIDIIEKSGARMLNIIHDIIDISKIEAKQMELMLSEVYIQEQINDVYTIFKQETEEKGISLQYICPDEELMIISDKSKIYAILTNLVKNAIKFTESGSIEFGYVRDNNWLEFYVKDSGVGIRKEQINIIFERFRQGSELLSRNYEGAGLGLPISKAYVEMLNGQIWVDSEENKGSTFYFTIPIDVSVDNTQQYANKEPKQNNQMKNLKILIAEDDQTSSNLIAIVVKKISKEIIIVKSGIDAVEACRNNPDIDLILMDIKMPGINGYEATKLIREFNKKVIIIAQTAYAMHGDKEKAINTGCNDYITKPINHSLLSSIIQKHFNE